MAVMILLKMFLKTLIKFLKKYTLMTVITSQEIPSF